MSSAPYAPMLFCTAASVCKMFAGHASTQPRGYPTLPVIRGRWPGVERRRAAHRTAAAMTAGIAVSDGAFVMLASEGWTRLGALGTARLAYVLAAALALFGIVFIASAAIG